MLARCLPLLLAIGIAVPAGGEPAATPPAPDFSKGFERLVALGLPALDSKAKWSTLPENRGGGDDHYLREFLKPLKGNGWSLPPVDGKARGLGIGELAAVELSPSPSEEQPRSLLGRVFGGGGGSKKPAAIPEADLTKDVRALIDAFSKPNDNRDPFASSSSSGAISGKILLLATQIHQTGRTALANDLAMGLFDAVGSRETAVDAAVSMIADHAYESAAEAFFATGDWATYHRTLTDLVAKFPRGWSSREAVAMLLPQLAKQAAGEKPPVLSLPGIPLDPKALEAIERLAAKPEAKDSAAEAEKMVKRYGMNLSSMSPRMRAQVFASLRSQGMEQSGSSSPWLLGATDEDEETDTSPPLAQLTALGINALPALAALVDDPLFTQIPNSQARNRSSYYSSDEGAAERILRVHASLNRPSTRGEIARGLLGSALPNSSEDSDQPDPEALRESALAFWKANKDATRDELAAVFLRDGSSYQTQTAATLLASSADPKAHKVFEAHVLAADPALEQLQNVQTYLAARKAAAKPFFEAYAKLIRTQSAGIAEEGEHSNRYSYQINQAGGLEKLLKQLGNLVTEKSPHALAKEIAKGNPADAQAEIQSLLALMKGDSPTKILYAMLEGAVTAEDPVIRSHFLSATRWLGRENYDELNEEGASAPSPDRPLAEAEIKVWQKLVADTREVPNDSSRSPGSEKWTVGDLAANALAASINPKTYQATVQAAPILQKDLREIRREQAAAYLSGKPIPPLPDGSHVTPDRLRAIVAEAGEKPAPEIHPYLATLTPDDRAAWLDWVAEPGDLPLPPSVKELRFLVIGRSDRDSKNNRDVKDVGIIDPGFIVTPATLKAIVESLAADVSKHSRTTLAISSAEFGPGLEVQSHTVALPQAASDDESDDAMANRYNQTRIAAGQLYPVIQILEKQESTDAAIMIRMSSDNDEIRATWLIQKGKASPVIPQDQSTLDKTLKTLVESPESQQLHLQLEILTQADAAFFMEAIRN
jgi:hypothetical protein